MLRPVCSSISSTPYRYLSSRSCHQSRRSPFAYLADLTQQKRKAMVYGVLGGEGDAGRRIKYHRGRRGQHNWSASLSGLWRCAPGAEIKIGKA